MDMDEVYLGRILARQLDQLVSQLTEPLEAIAGTLAARPPAAPALLDAAMLLIASLVGGTGRHVVIWMEPDGTPAAGLAEPAPDGTIPGLGTFTHAAPPCSAAELVFQLAIAERDGLGYMSTDGLPF